MSRILLVDDHKSVRTAIRCCLEAKNHQCLEAADGMEALAYFDQQQHIDLVITDNQMPIMTGLELLKKLQQRFGSTAIPIIFHTGNMTAEAKEEALQSGAYAVLGKPFEFRDLVILVEQALDRG